MENSYVATKEPQANRQYKDTVFRMLFSERKNLLSLYNAVAGKTYERTCICMSISPPEIRISR